MHVREEADIREGSQEAEGASTGFRRQTFPESPQGDEQAQVEPYFPTVDDAVEFNQAALEHHGQTNHALLRPDVLEGALGRAQNQYHYTGSMANAAAALAHGVGQAQAFEDGNKRTAYFLTQHFLEENGYPTPEDDEELADHLIGYGEGTHQLEHTADMFRTRYPGRISRWQVSEDSVEAEYFEDWVRQFIGSDVQALPPHTVKIGAALGSWHEMDPGVACIMAEGGTPADRDLAVAYLREALEPHDFKLAQFTLEWDHSDKKLIKEADWEDIEAKAKRLIQSGQVQILRNSPNVVIGQVEGDHGTYQTEIKRDDPNSEAISLWDCECDWDQFAWQRTRQWKKYEGRVCLSKKTVISMADGSFKYIPDVVKGDRVLTHDGIGTVTKTMATPYDGEFVVISPFGYDEPLRITPTHSVYGYGTPQRFRRSWQNEDQGFKIWDEDFLFDSDPDWIESRDLLRHDWMVGVIRDTSFGGPIDVVSFAPSDWLWKEEHDQIRRYHRRKNGNTERLVEYNLQGTLPRLLHPSHALMIILGLYAAEGCFGSRVDGYPGEIQWSFNADEEDTLGRALGDALENLGLERPHLHRHSVAKTISYRLTHHVLALILDVLCGRYSQRKSLHPWLLYLNPDYQETFLSWLWAGDGHSSPGDSRKHLSTSSDHLAWQTHDMLLRCGYLPSWNRHKQNGGPANRQTTTPINQISWVEDRINRRVGNGKRLLNDNFYAMKIRDIQSEPFTGTVYNLAVDDQESYVANGVVVHNCSHVLATYWLAKTLPMDEEQEPGEGGGGGAVPGAGGMVPPGASPGILEGAPGGATQGQPQAPAVGQAPEPPNLIPEFPGDPAMMPAMNPVSVPGQKPQSPLNPIQNIGVPGVGGTFSHVFAGQQYTNGDMVQLKEADVGQTVGLNSGDWKSIGTNSIGEVLGTDPSTGWVNVYFAGPQAAAGKEEPHGVTGWFSPEQLIPRPDIRAPGPAIRRR